MKKRVTLALAAGALMAALLPGMASAGAKTALCHYPGHLGLYQGSPVHDWYPSLGLTWQQLPSSWSYLKAYCVSQGGNALEVGNGALRDHQAFQGAPID